MPFSRYRAETRTLLGSQLDFNLGFYAVIPFLAGAVGTNTACLDAAAVGLVLGVVPWSALTSATSCGGVISPRGSR
jgi:hypothetical protein